MSWTAFGDFSQAWSDLPRLEELRIRSGSGGTLGTLVVPRLKKFVRISGGLRATELASICTATWPELEHLEVWFGSANYGAEGDVTRITRILDGEGLPALNHLGLVNCEFSDSLIPALARSKVLPRLRTLDLSKGIMTGRAASALVEHASAFRHLEAIDLRENLLGPDYVVAIQKTKLRINTDKQREYTEVEEDDGADYDYRYCAVGE